MPYSPAGWLFANVLSSAARSLIEWLFTTRGELAKFTRMFSMERAFTGLSIRYLRAVLMKDIRSPFSYT